jgi:hypothetical protein
MANRRVGPPTLIGVLCRIQHPGLVVGKVRMQPGETRQAENERQREKADR